MDMHALRSLCLLGVVLAPFAAFMVISLWSLFAGRQSEDFVTAIAKASSLVATASVFVLIGLMFITHESSYIERYESWFSFENHHFETTFSINSLSVGFLVIITLLSGLVAKFSRTYIHLESGFTRFYLLLQLATFGMTLVVVADSLGLTVVGWEFLGISSTLLIAFFHARRSPVVHGIRAFIVYRIGDLGLLLALLYAHTALGTTELNQFIHTQNDPYGVFRGTADAALILGLLFFLSAAGKSSILPFFPWLPSAMEGPTPSSAIFYGAFAVHAGPYLFLRQAPMVSASTTLSLILVVVGLLSAAFATLAGRVRADVKTALAYATITQVSLIYVEIGLHWYYLAAVHTAGHMCLRTYQILRAPSALHDVHVRTVLGVSPRLRTAIISRAFGPRVERWLFRFAVEEGCILTLYQQLLVRPFLVVAAALSRFEELCDRVLDRVLGGYHRRSFIRRLSSGASSSSRH